MRVGLFGRTGLRETRGCLVALGHDGRDVAARCRCPRAPHIDRMGKLLVWFDGGCPLCRREIALMRRLDRRNAIHFVDVAEVSGEACPIDRGALLARFHASENGRLLSGAAAFAAMWRAIPLLRPLGLAARNRWVLGVLEAGYRGFLRLRPFLQSAIRRFEPA